MKRKLTTFVIAAASISLWSFPASAADFYHQVQSQQYHSGHFEPALYWPKTSHEPAISKTLSTLPNIPIYQVPAPAYNYDWQSQPAPQAPAIAVPQFFYPQQGYFPRDEIKPRIAPGYEYNYGGIGSYPPAYPIEGANWKAPRAVGLGQATQAAPEYAHCPL